jgi:hypothetical protein
LEKGWILGDDFSEALARSGASITPDQIERWRREELLPHPRQVGHGRGKGSHSEVPQVSVTQAQAIAYFYGRRRKRDWVGWQLWLNGFEVTERYWREPLEKARNDILETRQAARRYNRSSGAENSDPATLKSEILTAVRDTPFYAALANIRPDIVETLAAFFLELLIGEFAGFTRESDLRPNEDERAAVLAVMGVRASANSRIADFAGLIEGELKDIAKALSALARRNSIAEPSPEARRELLAAIEIGISLYSISKVMLGRKALGTLNRIVANPPISIQAAMLLAWTEYRAISRSKRSFAEIAQMAELALQLVSKNCD